MGKVKTFFYRLFRILTGILIILASIYILLSILFYDKNDQSLSTVTSDTIIHNKMGKVGSYLSDFFIQTFGFASIFITLVFIKIGYNLIIGKFKRYNLYYKLIMFTLFVTVTTTLISKNLINKTSYEILNGGFLGLYVNNLTSEISNYIVSPIFLLIDLIALTILFDKSLKTWEIFLMRIALKLKYTILFVLKLSLVPLINIFNIKKSKKYDVFEKQNKKIKELEEYIYNIENKKNNDLNEHPTEDNNFTYEKKEIVKKQPSRGLFNFSKIDKKSSSYMLPKTNILNEHLINSNQVTKDELYNKANELKRVLGEFKVNGKVVSVKAGPIITLFEFEPSAGIKSSRIIGLADDIARNLIVKSTRISVIENKNAIGIEIPNRVRDTIYLKELLESEDFKNTKYILPIILGTNISGEPVIIDLAKAPHLLIAGTTGSGKSVSINTMILSLLYKFSPEECKFIMIDPKMLELSAYDGIPHLLSPVVTNAQKAISSLRWVVSEMEERYRLMSNLGVRNISGYNEKIKKAENEGKPLTISVLIGYDEKGEPMYENKTLETKFIPYIVVVVDEMADLMITAGKDIEALIQRIAQMARAAGIHIIMATQRPSVDVITGVIKANFPSRISFLVSSKIDSKVIIGEQGAEQLLGYGDMLYSTNGAKLARAHGPFVSDDEVEKVVKFIKSQGLKPSYIREILENEEENNDGNNFEININGNSCNSDDELYKQAVQIVLRDRKTSISYLQRVLRIGYNKSATIIEKMEKEGILSAPNTKGLREIIGE